MFKTKKPSAALLRWRVFAINAIFIKLYKALTMRHQLHPPEPVGMFAGSLLTRSDWDHP